MKNKVIAFITHTHQKNNKFTHTHTKNNTLTLVAIVCKKKEQPELHQLTTKQQRNILSNRKNHTAVKRKKKKTNLKEEQRLSKLCFNQQTQKS